MSLFEFKALVPSNISESVGHSADIYNVPLLTQSYGATLVSYRFMTLLMGHSLATPGLRLTSTSLSVQRVMSHMLQNNCP